MGAHGQAMSSGIHDRSERTMVRFRYRPEAHPPDAHLRNLRRQENPAASGCPSQQAVCHREVLAPDGAVR